MNCSWFRKYFDSFAFLLKTEMTHLQKCKTLNALKVIMSKSDEEGFFTFFDSGILDGIFGSIHKC